MTPDFRKNTLLSCFEVVLSFLNPLPRTCMELYCTPATKQKCVIHGTVHDMRKTPFVYTGRWHEEMDEGFVRKEWNT